MFKFLQTIDAKVITSAGGIVLAIILGYFLYDISSNRIAEIVTSVNASTVSNAGERDKLADALLKNAVAIEGNTKVMQQLQESLRYQNNFNITRQ